MVFRLKLAKHQGVLDFANRLRYLDSARASFRAVEDGTTAPNAVFRTHNPEAFVAALVAGADPAPSLGDGLKAQAVAEAATRSLASGRMEPVRY